MEHELNLNECQNAADKYHKQVHFSPITAAIFSIWILSHRQTSVLSSHQQTDSKVD
jgi:hypothetical protein